MVILSSYPNESNKSRISRRIVIIIIAYEFDRNEGIDVDVSRRGARVCIYRYRKGSLRNRLMYGGIIKPQICRTYTEYGLSSHSEIR